MDNPGCWLLTGLSEQVWWQELNRLELALNSADGTVAARYAALYRALLAAGHDSVPAALAAELLHGTMPVTPAQLLDGSVREAFLLDLARLTQLAGTDWQQLAVTQAGQPLPALSGLALQQDELVAELALRLQEARDSSAWLDRVYARQGQGELAAGLAWRLRGTELELISRPARAEFRALYGLEPQLQELRQAVEPWLAGRPSLNVLLYGPRGSGKSTAARALLTAFAVQGLRLIEVPPAELRHLPQLIDRLAGSPLKFVLFVDDLSFGRNDSAWQQFKSLLDGTLQELPANVMLLATSNRRRLLAQRFADRPDPLSDDVHAWDTQDEQLAFSDRFGLVITFPAADQRRFLGIVRSLAEERGLQADGLEEAALLFARRGNGMSGRTARQFVDSLSSPEASLKPGSRS